MAAERRFTLIGELTDRISPKLKSINRSLENTNRILKSLNSNKTLKNLEKGFDHTSRSIGKMHRSIEDATKVAGKLRDTVSQIGEGVKGLDGIAESLETAARAAARTQENVSGIGEAAGKANRQADGLLETLLKANALVNIGDAMGQGFGRGFNIITGGVRRVFGIFRSQYKAARDDQMADIKAQAGIQGSFTMAGFKGSAAGGGVSFPEAGKMYKAFDREIAEMIRTSAAPTAKVIELQRYTLDTIGPLALAAEGVAKGTDIRRIDPKQIQQSARTYGAFLEKAALLSQGTGSQGFRVASGIEQLVTRGKIDTTMDFFTDNVLLMQTLEKKGFAGRGQMSSKMMSAAVTNAERFQAMLEAFEGAQSGEATAALAQTVQGSMQALDDTINNSTVGLLGMANTFVAEEQAKVNAKIREIYNKRIASYEKELRDETTSKKRAEQIRIDIQQTAATRDKLTKKNEEQITTPFLAINLAFTQVIQKLTEALSEVGPIWTEFSIGVLDFSLKFVQPIADNLKAVASNIRAGEMTKPEALGRIAGEIFKGLGEALGAIGKMLANPKGPMSKIQNEFLQGFMSAFKDDPKALEKARKGIADGIYAIIRKFMDILLVVLMSEEMRPIVLGALALAFGPPLIASIISGMTPLVLGFMGKLLVLAYGKVAGTKAASTAAHATPWMARLGGAGAGAAGASAGGVAGGGLAAALALPLLIAAAVAAVIIFQGPLLDLAAWFTNTGSWLTKSKDLLSQGVGQAMIGFGQIISGITNLIAGLWDILVGMWTGDQNKIREGFGRFGKGILNLILGLINMIVGTIKTFGGWGIKLKDAIGNLFSAIWAAITNQKVPDKPTPQPKPPPPDKTTPGGRSGGGRYRGGLGDAISSELKHKPAGSSLVIANSSETIIPAAGGLGMTDFMRTLKGGFSSMYSLINYKMSGGYGSFGSTGGGGVYAPVTIYQQPNQDAEELASLVAMRIGMAVHEAQNH